MKKKVIGIASIISIIILLTILVIFISGNKKIDAAQEDIYDIILFWGQSNMVGWPNTDQAMPSGFNDKQTFSEESGIDLDILQNTKSTSVVNTPIKAGTAYIYKPLKNTFDEITSQTRILGDGFEKSDYIGTSYENSRGGLTYNPSTGTFSKFVLGTSSYISAETSYNVNMIPEFCRTYHEKTGHKVIAVTGAVGGVSIQTFLPQTDPNNPNYSGVKYMYEAIVASFNRAVQLANQKGYQIGGKYWVCCQGEANIHDTSTSSFTGNKVAYEQYFTQVKNNFKRDLGTTVGTIVETAEGVGNADISLDIMQMHNSQENLIKNNDDIILGSSFVYDRWVPEESTYNSSNFVTKVYLNEAGNKIAYSEALRRAKMIGCYDYYWYDSGISNGVHFTSATLSQMGRDAANNLAKEVKDTYVGTNVKASFDEKTGEVTIYSVNTVGTLSSSEFRKFIDTVCGGAENITKITFTNRVVLSSVSSTGVFRDLINLTEIENIENFIVTYVTDLSYMFYNCKNLIYMDLDIFFTTSATNMSHMFENCSNLIRIDIQDLLTSKVTNMESMFQNCSRLSTINMGTWDTGSVTNMSNMFQGCIGLSKLDMSQWDMSNVISLNNMLNGCSTLAEVETPKISPSTSITLPTTQWYNSSDINDNTVYSNFKFTNTVTLKKLIDYQINYNLDSGIVTGNPNTYNALSSFALKNPTRAGYTFDGWTGSNGTTKQKNVTVNGRTMTGELTYTANWTGNKISYTVNHWQQKLTGDANIHDSSNYDKTETEDLEEVVDTNVTPVRKNYTGFTAPQAQTVTIKADGSTEVNYYYTRNRYQVTLTKDEGIEAVTGANTYYYGQSVTINATVKENHLWVNWTGDETFEEIQNTITMPARDIEFRANTVKRASVTTKYIDINTNKELATTIVDNGYEGKDYNTTQKEINGYQFLRVDGTATGKMSGATTVTYYYAKNAKIEINYLDKTTNQVISTKKEIEGYIGKEYDVKPMQIKGYKYSEDSNNTKGNIEEELIQITFKYLKETGVNVKYVDINTDEEIVEAKSYDYLAMDEYDVTEDYKDIDLYTFIKDSGNTKGTMTNDEEDVIYYYAYNSSIIIKYYDIFTNREIEKEELIEGYEGKEYTTKPKEIEGYKFTKVNNAEGKMERETIEVNYYYTKKVTTEIQYINYDTGESIAEGKLLNGLEGEEYNLTSEIKEINGYQYKSASVKLQGMNTSENMMIKLYYKKNENIIQGNQNNSNKNEGNSNTNISSSNGDYTVANGKIPKAGKSIVNISIIIAIIIIGITLVFYIKYKKYNYVK